MINDSTNQGNKKVKTFLKYTLIIVTGVFAINLLIQIFYPTSILPWGTNIGGKNLSGWDKRSAINELNHAYDSASVKVLLGQIEDEYKTIYPEDFGLTIDNKQRIDNITYPWYVRIVPTSLFWWGSIVDEGNVNLTFDEDELDYFVEDTFGMPCYVEPKNASLSIDGSSVNISKSHIGGICYQSIVKENFREISFNSSDEAVLIVDLTEEYPDVETEDATELALKISPNIVNDLVFEIDGVEGTVTLDHQELITWISFDVEDKKIIPKIDEKKSSEFYKTRIAPMVEQNAGVTTFIAAEDLSSVRIDGVEGRVINVIETNLRIAEYLQDLRKTVVVAVELTDPSINYVYNRPNESDQAEASSETNTQPETNTRPNNHPQEPNTNIDNEPIEETED